MADKLYETFIQKNGPRKGQEYRVKRGASGANVRIYETGDNATVPGTTPKQRRPLGSRRLGLGSRGSGL